MKGRTVPMRVYTPGLPASAQPAPHETIPINVLVEVTMGPPLSPWHESLPPAANPAQNMLLVIAAAL